MTDRHSAFSPVCTELVEVPPFLVGRAKRGRQVPFDWLPKAGAQDRPRQVQHKRNVGGSLNVDSL
jgi:hypothetical protein